MGNLAKQLADLVSAINVDSLPDGETCFQLALDLDRARDRAQTKAEADLLIPLAEHLQTLSLPHRPPLEWRGYNSEYHPAQKALWRCGEIIARLSLLTR